MFWIEFKPDAARRSWRVREAERAAPARAAVARRHAAAHRCSTWRTTRPTWSWSSSSIARRADLRLLSAADGNLGIEFARAYLPDVILMDINLPGISGIEAMKILRADPSTAHIPIIALSANAVPRDIEKGLEAGFFNYLTKPIKVDRSSWRRSTWR